jgi:hypothetical protein
MSASAQIVVVVLFAVAALAFLNYRFRLFTRRRR